MKIILNNEGEAEVVLPHKRETGVRNDQRYIKETILFLWRRIRRTCYEMKNKAFLYQHFIISNTQRLSLDMPLVLNEYSHLLFQDAK